MNEPLIEVGILADDEIRIKPATGSSMIVPNVSIGTDFHWERKEEQKFGGEFKIVKEGNKLRLINIIPIEEYLTSVISSEMSANSPLELLKAHAVISRTWLLAQKEKAGRIKSEQSYSSVTETEEEYIRWYDREDHTLFDVCADDHCQRYQGITKASTDEVKEAVESTRGEILTFEGAICDTRFSKCCGGKTENFENVWEPVPHPYLQSVTDEFCGISDKKILARILNAYDQETEDFYRWNVELRQEEISALIRKKTGWDFGAIIDLIPLERGESGRIIKLKIIGSLLTKTVGKELFIRKILSESHLYSSAFEIEKKYDENGLKFLLKGSGWGHGVGLCQIGAAMMAEKGYDYSSILQHYFPGTQLQKKY
jgi:SpoIID/LytB domain protein